MPLSLFFLFTEWFERLFSPRSKFVPFRFCWFYESIVAQHVRLYIKASHVTEEKLSLLTGLDERTIRRVIKRLKDAGYMTVQTTVKEDADRGFIKRNSYYIKPANKDYFFLDNSFFKRNYPAKIAGFLLLLKSVCLNNTDTVQ